MSLELLAVLVLILSAEFVHGVQLRITRGKR